MNLISVHNASKEIAGKMLYQSISFGVDDSDKIALIGVNGCGKSTLLKILSGQDHFDSGEYARNNSLKCGYLGQEVLFKTEESIRDFIFSSGNDRMKVLREFLEAKKSGLDQTDSLHWESLKEKMSELDAWKLEGEAGEVLGELNIDHMEYKMGELSGGMVRKVALAKVLLEENNLILLDEPTNHLDINSIAWLEDYLRKIKKSVLIITHDRYFLDNVVNFILEIDHQQVNKYKGHYSYYLEKKSEIAAIEQRTLEKHQKILASELQWLNRMPKARGTKQKARIQEIEKTHSFVQSSKPETKMGGLYSVEQKQGKKILEAVNVSKAFDGNLIFPAFYHEFAQKERYAIIGENGAGKTTFLKVLMKELEPDTGSVVHGVNTRIGYLSQHSEKVSESLTLIGAVKEVANYIEYEDGKKISAGQLLERFLFEGPKQHQKVNRLSGGERRRLDIIRVLMTNPNFLILDEPTNDLDLQTLSIFEEYLMEFPGCLLIVSHDRYFLDKLSSQLLVFEKGKPIQSVIGLCSEYLEKKRQEAKEKSGLAVSAKAVKNEGESLPEKDAKAKPKKLSYKNALRKEEIEKILPAMEIHIKDLEKKLSSGESDPKLLTEWGLEHSEKEKRLYDLLAELDDIENSIQ